MTTHPPAPLPRRGGGRLASVPPQAGPADGPASPAGAVLRYELTRPDRLYLAQRRLVDAGYAAGPCGPVPGSRTLLVLQVEGLTTQADVDRVSRVVRGSDPDSRRI